MDLKGVDSEGDEQEDKSAEEVGVYIDRFIVEIEETLERTKVGV